MKGAANASLLLRSATGSRGSLLQSLLAIGVDENGRLVPRVRPNWDPDSSCEAR